MKKQKHFWIIILSGLCIGILLNVKLVWYYADLFQSQNISEIAPRILKRFYIGLKDVASQFLLFTIIAFYNYSWKDFFLKRIFLNRGKKQKITFIIFTNLILLLVLLYADYIIEKKIDPSFSGHLLIYYIMKYIWTVIIAIIMPYFMIQNQKTITAEKNIIKLREEKSRAELVALKEQISPHFFFNTLSTLNSIIRNEKKEVGLDFIENMSNTYRYILTTGQDDLVTLGEELNFVKSYVYLLQKRFGEKLKIDIKVDKLFYTKRIPPMALQLLFENAIQHNIITKKLPLEVRVRVENNRVVVANDLQIKKDVQTFGIGLNNLRNRYKLLTERAVEIISNDSEFIVKLPIL